jgi:hypothetical protein
MSRNKVGRVDISHKLNKEGKYVETTKREAEEGAKDTG